MTVISRDRSTCERPKSAKTSALETKQAILFCALAFVASRSLLLTVGYLAYTGRLPLSISPDRAMNEVFANPFLDIWFAWDSNWYLSIVTDGYQPEAGSAAGAGFKQANWAFFPFYPWVSANTAYITGLSAEVSLLLVANIAFLAALFLLYRELTDLADESAAKLAVILLLVWPGTHFFSSAYTESLFLLCVVATLRFARLHRFLAAATVAALATLTRSPGIMLVFPIALYAWQAWAKTAGRPLTVSSGFKFALSMDGAKTLAICCLPLTALLGFMAHLYAVSGDPIAFANIQEAWGRQPRNPFMEFVRPLIAPSTIPIGQWPDYLSMWLLPIPIYLLWRDRNWPYLTFAAILCLLAITAGVVSLNRQMLVVFPITAIVAMTLARSKLATIIVIPLAALGAFILMAFWSAGYGVV